MKMFLTRIGFNTAIVVIEDITKIDLPCNQTFGLTHAITVLSIIDNISFNFFNKEDSMRHAIINHIIDTYEKWDKNKKECSIDKYRISMY